MFQNKFSVNDTLKIFILRILTDNSISVRILFAREHRK